MLKLPSLRARLLWGALLWVAIASVAGGLALSYAFRSTVQSSFDARLNALLTTLIAAVEVGPDGDLALERRMGDPRFDEVYSGWYWWLQDAHGVHLRSRSLWDLQMDIEQPLRSFTPSLSDRTDPIGRRLRVAAQTVSLQDKAQPVTFVLTADVGELQAEIRRFDLLLLLALGALGIGLLIGVALQVTFGLAPLRRIGSDIEAVRTGSVEQLRHTGTHEVDLLVDEVNSLLEHSKRVVARARASTADLAHALKTPLAVLKSTDVASSLDREQLEAIERTITWHLTRAATAGPGQRAQIAVAPIIEDVVNGMSRVHAERNLQVRHDLQGDSTYAADVEDLEELAGNLVENAFKWARSTISIATRNADDHWVLSVDDDGPGLIGEQLERAVERGARFDRQTPGTGLGLAIVSDIAQMYGGSLRLSRSELGGLRAELHLPDSR
jgi:signal transduction histidine kinase